MTPDQERTVIEAMTAERKALKRGYKGLYRELTWLLYIVDPMNIQAPHFNEYEPEVGTILPRLKSCQNPADVQRVLIEEFDRWFGPGAFYPSLAVATAEPLFHAACRHGICKYPSTGTYEDVAPG